MADTQTHGTETTHDVSAAEFRQGRNVVVGALVDPLGLGRRWGTCQAQRAWIFRRCDGEADAQDTAIGLVPAPEH
jgi:hypothetical protein